ncbi:aminopeptidase Ey-like [Pomacea canaliculata]|uniref:aminopeptidase Ey-like n=1 Tax=Pomacea canaliculata TaxID=400727 RepID=UPI000D7294A0|nr:aminopeptidase Ey-like [Pomacea canaliculata]
MPARSGWRNCKNKIGKYKKKITAVVSAILIAVAVFFPLKHFNEEYMKQALNVGTTSSAIASQLIYRLPTALRPLHYDLELIPDIYQANSSNFSFQGTVKIEFVCRNQTSDVILHAVDLTIVELDVQLRSWDPQDDPNILIKSFQISKERETLELHLLRPLQEKYRYLLTVTFRGQITDLFRSMYFSSYQENNQTKYFVSTIFVPNHARLAFPCFDEPAFKARFTLTILRKENFISISNMPRNDTHERIIDGDVWFVDHFLTTPLMSTYLLTFTVCQFNYKEVNSSRGYKLRAWSRPTVSWKRSTRWTWRSCDGLLQRLLHSGLPSPRTRIDSTTGIPVRWHGALGSRVLQRELYAAFGRNGEH